VRERVPLLTGIVAVFHVVLSLVLIFLILLHAGRGGGVSDMFGGGFGGGGPSGSTIMERNLDRITVAAAVSFGITTFLLTWLWS
jgi:preprotein translocase subunit SecG